MASFLKRHALFLLIFVCFHVFFAVSFTSALRDFIENGTAYSQASFLYTTPIELLQNLPHCSQTLKTPLCGLHSLYLPLVMLFVEGWVITFLNKTKLQGGKALLYFMCMQVFLVSSIGFRQELTNSIYKNYELGAIQRVEKASSILQNFDQKKQNNILDTYPEIITAIKTADMPPILVEENATQSAILYLLEKDPQKIKTFYDVAIVPHVIKTQFNNALASDILYLPKNILIINKVNVDTVENLIPAISTKYIQTQFPSKVNKPEAKFTTYNEKQYDEYTKVEKEKYIQQIKDYISYAKNYISEITETIEFNRSLLKKFPEDANEINAAVRQGINYKARAEVQLREAEKFLEEAQKSPFVGGVEYGSYRPPDKIALRYFSKTSEKFSFYNVIGVHEYLHYYSHASSNRPFQFIDEAMTEHLTGAILAKHKLYDHSAQSYEHEIKVLKKLMSRIPEKDMIDMYFSANSDAEFKALFLEHFPEVSYTEFESTGKALFFTPLNDQKTKKDLSDKLVNMLK